MTTSGLTYDPKTGLAIIPPDRSNPAVGGQQSALPTLSTQTPTNSGGVPSTPWDIFAQNLTKLLGGTQANANPAPLLAQRDQLVNQGLNLSNPLNNTPYKEIFAGMSPGNSLSAQNNIGNSINPGITSINSQLENANQLTQNFTNAANAAYQYNKPLEVPQGTTLMNQSGQTLSRAQQYLPGTNPNTLLPDTYVTNPDGTGYWISAGPGTGSQQQNQGGQQSGSTKLIGGADFTGVATGTKPYATDPNYVDGVDGAYQGIVQAIPVPNAQAYDQYISSHSKGSTISGNMLLTAAATNKIDPNALAAQLLWESDFGTSNVAKNNNNPMGILYVGQPGATQGTPRPASEGGYYAAFPSMQQGLNAGAAIHAKYVPGNAKAGDPTSSSSVGQSTQQGAVSNVGGQFSPEASKKVTQLPSTMQAFVDAGPLGVAYINEDRVPEVARNGLKVVAARAGIPYLAAGDAGALKSLGTVLQNVDNMNALSKTELSAGMGSPALGKAVDVGKSILHLTGAFPELDRFNIYRDTAINAVKGLAGGAGSGLRINGAEIEANVNALPTTYDSLQSALTKTDQLKKYLTTQLSATFPYITSSTLPSGGSSGGGSSAGTKIRVKIGNQTGTIDASEFNPATMQKI